jgi:hypothetical protein
MEEISARTGITLEDTLHTLTAMSMLKYYKGAHIICLSEKHREGPTASTHPCAYIPMPTQTCARAPTYTC